jgi:hypothetical protein
MNRDGAIDLHDTVYRNLSLYEIIFSRVIYLFSIQPVLRQSIRVQVNTFWW